MRRIVTFTLLAGGLGCGGPPVPAVALMPVARRLPVVAVVVGDMTMRSIVEAMTDPTAPPIEGGEQRHLRYSAAF